MGMSINQPGGGMPPQYGFQQDQAPGKLGGGYGGAQQAGHFSGLHGGQFGGQFGGPRGGGTPPTNESAAARLVQRLDRDGDGNISLDSEIGSGRQAMHGAMLRAADADSNGTVSKDELLAQLTAADTDSSGSLSRSEMAVLRDSVLGSTTDAESTATETDTADTVDSPIESVEVPTPDPVSGTTTTSTESTSSTSMQEMIQSMMTQLQAMLDQLSAGE